MFLNWQSNCESNETITQSGLFRGVGRNPAPVPARSPAASVRGDCECPRGRAALTAAHWPKGIVPVLPPSLGRFAAGVWHPLGFHELLSSKESQSRWWSSGRHWIPWEYYHPLQLNPGFRPLFYYTWIRFLSVLCLLAIIHFGGFFFFSPQGFCKTHVRKKYRSGCGWISSYSYRRIQGSVLCVSCTYTGDVRHGKPSRCPAKINFRCKGGWEKLCVCCFGSQQFDFTFVFLALSLDL